MERIDILKEPELHLKGEQKRVYKLSSDAPVLVKGSAGSGKTLVAMARARFLRNLMTQDMFLQNARIAFFTYDKSLRDEVAGYFTNDSRVLVDNIDRWAASFLFSRSGSRPNALTDYRIRRECLTAARSVAFAGVMDRTIAKKSNDFYIEEIEWMKGRLVENEGQYIEIDRKGRGEEIRRKEDRPLMWKMKTAFEQELAKRNMELFSDRIIASIKELEGHPMDESHKFWNIIVDEAQDFTAAKLRLITMIARGDTPSTKRISLFLDGAQAIYESGSSWKSAGIEVRGRTSIFTRNYRNTRQIAEAANSLLDIVRQKDSLSEDDDIVDMTIPEREGEKPIVLLSSSGNAAVELLKIVNSIAQNETIAIGTCTNNDAKFMEGILSKQYIVRTNGSTKTCLQDGRRVIHIRTLQKMKGLQFDNVFLWNITDGVFPSLMSDVNELPRLRKLLYVAMTRACKKLVICVTLKPSVLLQEIDQSLLEVRNV